MEQESLTQSYECMDIGETAEVDHSLDILRATWMPEDRIEELENILEGASVNMVEKKFVKYVVENIEPNGWRAFWRFKGGTVSSVEINEPLDFVVDVNNVSHFSLTAIVLIKEVVNISPQYKDVINKEVAVPLYELFPIGYQENKAIDIERTTEVIEQIRFFYTNLILPWDIYEEICCFSKHLLQDRMQTYEHLQSGIIPRNIATEMKILKEKGKKIITEIEKFDKQSVNEFIDQSDIVSLLNWNKEIDSVKTRYEALRDPVCRELNAHQQMLERKSIFSSCLSEEPANILVVASSVSVDDFVQYIMRLPDILSGLPSVPDMSRVKTLPSLQIALDVAEVGDVVALLPGTYPLRHMGALAQGGVLLGLNEGVEITGCTESGDILLALTLSEDQRFVLQSITLKPLEEQASVSLLRGRMLIRNCSFIEGSVGLSLLGKSECKLENCSFLKQEKYGVECRNESMVIVKDSTFAGCQRAALLKEGVSKIVIASDSSVTDCKIGIELASKDEKPLDLLSKSQSSNAIFLPEAEKLKFNNTEEKFAFTLEGY